MKKIEMKKQIKQIKQIKQGQENDEPEKEKTEKEKNDLFNVRSDIDSTNSTIEKMEDFLDEHGVSSDGSTAESVQPMESASFPIDFGELQQRYKEQEVKKQEAKKPEIIPFKKALESRRSDFEEIRQHLERRSQEMKKRVKKIGESDKPEKAAGPSEKKEDDSSLNLSYHSTEFTPDLDCNLTFRPSESLTQKEKLQIYSDKCRREKSKETDEKSDKADADSCPATHAIFTHLAKMKSVTKSPPPACKLDLKAKTAVKTKAKAKVLEPIDSDPSLSLHRRESAKSVTSRTSLRSDSKLESKTSNLDD